MRKSLVSVIITIFIVLFGLVLLYVQQHGLALPNFQNIKLTTENKPNYSSINSGTDDEDSDSVDLLKLDNSVGGLK